MDKSKSDHRKYFILGWIAIAIFYAYQYVLRVIPSVALQELKMKFDATPMLFGQFSGIYYVSYALMHIPMGFIIDKFGLKNTVPWFIIIAAAGSLPLLYSDNFFFAILGRFLIGGASTASIIGAFKIIQICFDDSKFGFMLGLTATIGLIGATYASQSLNNFIITFGWQSVLLSIIIFGFCLAAVFYLIFTILKIDQSNIKNKENGVSFLDIKSVITNKNIIYISILGGLMIGPLEGFADTWGIEFLKTVNNISVDTASSLVSCIFLGMCFGAPILGYFAQKTKSHLMTVTSSCAILLLCFIIIIFNVIDPNFSILSFTGINFLYSMFFGIGFFCGYQIPLLNKIEMIAIPRLTAMSAATANMIMMIFGFVFHNAIGTIVEYCSGGAQGSTTLQKDTTTSAIDLNAILMAEIEPIIPVLEQQQQQLFSIDALISGISVVPIALFVALILLILMMMGKQMNKKKNTTSKLYSH